MNLSQRNGRSGRSGSIHIIRAIKLPLIGMGGVGKIFGKPHSKVCQRSRVNTQASPYKYQPQKPGMPIRCTFLVYESANLVIPLYTIEDTVAHSPQPLCDHCRCTGWSNHFVSKRNEFGHLLCINGIEGGCKYLCGREIMDLRDRICTILQARKITVEDVSKKKSMDLRLLHGVAYGHPWFGRWRYKFYHRRLFG